MANFTIYLPSIYKCFVFTKISLQSALLSHNGENVAMLLRPMQDEGENLAVYILILPLQKTVHRPKDLAQNFST